jgi:hypothetical protein
LCSEINADGNPLSGTDAIRPAQADPAAAWQLQNNEQDVHLFEGLAFLSRTEV